MATSASSVRRLLLVGLVFHLVYIGTVFDCYFTSPVVHGMQQYSFDKAEAKRLVLIVGDGLRADLLFAKNGFHMVPDAPDVVAPHLRSIVETRGAFGISHTRVPPESRPGHVALIGGMYEDVAAVTKGWKTNPVDFDSLFNQSSTTFSFGSPDILPMFARGATPGKVEMWCYDEHEDDCTKVATALDVWVLRQLRTLFQNATTDRILDARLRSDKTVFFLHLLGLDTTVHSYRPHSKEYMTNIQVVDQIVKQTEELVRDFYQDEETAFIFTADYWHGMSNIGNYVDGDPDNTRTPLIAWGKGIRGPLPDSVPSSHDAYSQHFGLSHLVRVDVEQADIAAIMSVLIGVNWPVNSVGVLPDADPSKPGYMAAQEGDKTQAEAALVNAKVVLEHYRMKHTRKKAHSLFYKPFTYFAQFEDVEILPGEIEIASIDGLLHNRRYNEARFRTKELIAHTLNGLRYLETYDRALIRGVVIAAYLGWIAYGVSILLPQTETTRNPGQISFHVVSMSVLGAFFILFAKQRSPWTFYLYIIFPCYFWDQADPVSGLVLQGALVVAALQSMVAGYTHRSIWSAWFVVIGFVWPVLTWPGEVRAHNWRLVVWSVCCLISAMFPLLSVHQKESLVGIIGSGIVMLIIGAIGMWRLPSTFTNRQEAKAFEVVLFLLMTNLGWSAIIVYQIISDLREKKSVSIVFQIIAWYLLMSTTVLPFTRPVGRSNPHARLLVFFLGFGTCFVWLSISVEGLFYVVYSLTLCVWVDVESALREHEQQMLGAEPQEEQKGAAKHYRPKADDLRIAVFFLFFVQVAFFGTGNVASISSFYLEPMYRLVPNFQPYLMDALLIFKTVSPYIILAIAFSILNARLDIPPFSLFLVALTLTDIMTITFFLNVTDTGSWLEIRQTISFFCISSLLLVWSAGICAVGEALMAGQPRGLRLRKQLKPPLTKAEANNAQ